MIPRELDDQQLEPEPRAVLRTDAPQVDVGEGGGTDLGLQIEGLVGRGQADWDHPRRAGRVDAGGRILDDDALGRHGPEGRCRALIHLGMWLAVLDILGAQHHRGYGKTRPAEPIPRRCPRARGGNRPRAGRKLFHQAKGARQRAEIARRVTVRDQGGDLGFGVEVRRGEANGLEGTAAVTDLQERLGIEPARGGPAAPLFLDQCGRVHQDAIEIQNHRRTVEPSHAR